MKTEDPFSPPGDQPDLNKLRRTKEPLSALGKKPVLCPFLQPGRLLPEGERGSPQRSLLGGPSGPTHLAPHLHPGYWCCRLGERETEPGLEGSELPPGACRAWGSSCGPARPGSPVPDSSLLSSFWLLCCSGHSKWTQWNTCREREQRPVSDGCCQAWGGRRCPARRLCADLGPQLAGGTRLRQAG